MMIHRPQIFSPCSASFFLCPPESEGEGGDVIIEGSDVIIEGGDVIIAHA